VEVGFFARDRFCSEEILFCRFSRLRSKKKTQKIKNKKVSLQLYGHTYCTLARAAGRGSGRGVVRSQRGSRGDSCEKQWRTWSRRAWSSCCSPRASQRAEQPAKGVGHGRGGVEDDQHNPRGS
jgi:hypothetical protein